MMSVMVEEDLFVCLQDVMTITLNGHQVKIRDISIDGCWGVV